MYRSLSGGNAPGGLVIPTAAPWHLLQKPVLIPIAMGLIGSNGEDMPLHLKDSTEDLGTSTVLTFDTTEATFTFVNVEERPVASLLRGFSAPVKMTVVGQTDEDLLHMLAHDSDEFNRWEAAQRCVRRAVGELIVRTENPFFAFGGRWESW